MYNARNYSMTANDEIYFNELKSFSPFFLYAPKIICFKFMYKSNGYDVVGYMTRPKNIDGKLSVITYNRGGNRDFGKLTKSQIAIQLSSCVFEIGTKRKPNLFKRTIIALDLKFVKL
jgi:hypothetical protein